MEYLKRVDCEVTIKLDEIIVISVSKYEKFKEELEALLDKYRLKVLKQLINSRI